MPLRPTNDVAWPVTLNDPVNPHHPLNKSRTAWWLTLPGWEGGRQWYDLMGLWHGTLTIAGTGMPAWRGTTRPGGWGCVETNQAGLSNYVSLMPAATPINTAGSLSLGCWFKCPSMTSTTYPGIVHAGGDSGHVFGISQTPTSDNNSIYAPFIDSGNPGGAGAVPAANVGTDNLWHRAVAVLNRATGVLSLYVDGKSVVDRTLPVNTGSITMTAPLHAGKRAITGSFYWSGLLDDVSLWSRALSAADAWADYDLSRAGYPGVLNRLAPGPRAAAAAIAAPASHHYRRRRAG